jgi:outer membrane protein assembly factor BamB/TolA-binding protein
MSPKKLINKLEALGKLDARIIAKLREQVGAAQTPPKATSILKYLVKKNLISETEAKQILKSDSDQAKAQKIARAASAEELVAIAAEEEAEIAEVENSLSEVVDPDELQLSKAPKGRKSTFTDSFVDMGSAGVAPPNDAGASENNSGSKDENFKKWDTKNQWTSKWPFIGFGILLFLIMIGSFLAIWLGGVDADKQYAAAVSSIDNLTFADAEEKFTNYLKDNPNHKHADDARALRVKAIMRNKFSSKRWAETIQTAQTLLPELSQQENNKLKDIRDDVGLMLSESLFQETESAVQLETLSEMEASVVQLNKYYKFIDNPNYLSGTLRKSQRVSTSLAEIENNIQTVNGLINKEKDYASTLVEIKQLGDSKETDKAFQTYIRMTREYPDLAARKELRDIMKGISTAEQDLVQPLDQATVTQTGAAASPLSASVVLASTVGEEVNGLRDEVIAALVDGAVYGFDAGTGEVRWRRFVGLQTAYPPKPFDMDTVIVSNLLRNEVSMTRLEDGAVVWRALIDEPFFEPTLNEQNVLVTTQSGKLILIDGATGEMVGGAKIPQAANSGGLIANRAPVLYQPGSYSNLYAISTTDFQCKEVLYLGHYRNSIPVPPISWSGYIILVRNGGDFADLLVLKPDETGLNLKVNQIVNRVTESQINTPIAYFGRGLILFGDRGDMRILELNPGNEISPVTVLAKERYDTQGQQSYIALKGSNIWAAGKGLRRYKVQRSLGQFKNEEVVEPGDVFLGQPTVIDDKLFHIRRRAGSNMASASLVDGKSLKPIWRTDFGGALGGVTAGDAGLTAVNNQGDIFDVSAADINSGVAKRAIISSEVIETLKFDQLMELGDDAFVMANSRGAKEMLFYKKGANKSRLFQMGIEPNDQPQQPPIAVGKHLIVASQQGLVSKIDPENGRIVGSPFLPPVSPGMKVPWQPLVPITNDVFAAAHSSVQDATHTMPSMLYFLSAENDASVSKVAELKFEQSIASAIVTDGRNVFGVQNEGTSDALFQVAVGRQPSISGTQTMANRYVAGPWLVGDSLLVQLDDDSLTCFDKKLQKKWALPIGNVQISSIPESTNGSLMVVFASGRILKLSAGQGTIEKQVELGQPIIGAPKFFGDNVVLRGADGTIHVLDEGEL